MTNILTYFLPAILALGIITSYEDIKTGKIRNKWIVLALVYAFVAYSILIAYAFFTTGINKDYFIVLATNTLFAIAVGFGAWYFNIWTAGDGKLFIAFCSIIPLSAYQIGYQKWMPSISLLVNIFIPALFVMLVWMLFKLKVRNVPKPLKSVLKELFQPKQLALSIIELFAFYWIVKMLFSLIGLNNNILIFMFTMIVLSSAQKKLGVTKCLYVLAIVSIIRLFMDESLYSLSFLADFSVLILVWRFFKSFLSGSLSRISQGIFTKEVIVVNLKPGMILSETIKKINEQELNDLKGTDAKIIRFKGSYYVKKPKSSIDTGGFIGEEAEGLTKEQIDRIKEIGVKKVLVSQTLPFAPFMFIGVLLTITVNGNVFIVIKNLI